MMKYLLLCIGLLWVQLTQAQDYFAPVGAKWHYQAWCMNSPLFGQPCDYISVEVIGDTIIEGKICKIIEGTYNGTPEPQAALYIHEENGELYFYEEQEFKLLFDFNLSVGDTLNFRVPQVWHYYDVSCSFGKDSIEYRSVVTDISTVVIDNVPLKSMGMQPVQNDSFEHWNLYVVRERIFMTPFLGAGHIFCLGGFPGYLRCYEDQDIFYKPASEDCDQTSFQSVQNIEAGQIDIFPNPVVDILHVKIDRTHKELIAIYDIHGTLQGEYSISKGNNILHLFDLATGIYILHFPEMNVYKKIVKL